MLWASSDVILDQVSPLTSDWAPTDWGFWEAELFVTKGWPEWERVKWYVVVVDVVVVPCPILAGLASNDDFLKMASMLVRLPCTSLFLIWALLQLSEWRVTNLRPGFTATDGAGDVSAVSLDLWDKFWEEVDLLRNELPTPAEGIRSAVIFLDSVDDLTKETLVLGCNSFFSFVGVSVCWSMISRLYLSESRWNWWRFCCAITSYNLLRYSSTLSWMASLNVGTTSWSRAGSLSGLWNAIT